MAFTYDGDPANSDLETVRFLIGDTDSTDALLQDAEVNWTLAQNSNVYFAASMAAETIASKFARKVDKAVGDLRQFYSQQSKQYRALATDLKRQASLKGSILPYAGGISVSDKEVVEENTDRVQPSFEMGMDDNVKSTYSKETE